MKLVASFCLTTMITFSAIGHEAHAEVKPEDAVNFRQGVFQVLKWNIGGLVAMAKNPDSFDKDRANLMAERLNLSGGMILEGFTEGSDMVQGSDAKLEIWDDRPGFEAAVNNYLEKAGLLVDAVTKADNPGAYMDQVKELGGSCKACHKKYRN